MLFKTSSALPYTPFMRKNKIVIRGAIELGADILPDNGYVAKLFSILSVEVDSQNVSSNRNK